MRLAYFDCFSGASGDMILAAAVDAGAPLAEIEAALRRLPVTGWTIAAERVARGAVRATRIQVAVTEAHHHRGLARIREILGAAGLPPGVAAHAEQVFTRLAEAEARVHGVAVDAVHFHEVGAVDAIVDIVGGCLALELLGVDEVACSALNVGAGRVQTAHGLLPVPAPATADLLRGAPTYSTGIERELVTPTGAAFLAARVARFGPMPPMVVRQIGYGAGAADLAEQPNVLRLFLGDALAAPAGAWPESVAVIETNLDDMNPQLYGYFAEQALEAGALDVFALPVQMKKNRPGQLVTILAEPGDVDRLVELLFRETTTLGVRVHEARRRTLARETVAVETPHGTVRMKVARRNGHVVNAAPEFEDCRRIAAACGLPLKQVLADAIASFHRPGGKAG